MRLLLIILVVLLASMPLRGGSITVKAFGGEWVFPDECELTVLGSINNEGLRIFCKLNEDDWDRTDTVQAYFYKQEERDLHDLEAIAWPGSIERESVGLLNVKTWKTDVSKLTLLSDPDPEYLQSLRQEDSYYRFICDGTICLWLSSSRLDSLDELTNENIQRITRRSSRSFHSLGRG